MSSIVSHYLRYLVKKGARHNDQLTLPELRESMEGITRLVRPPRAVNVQRITVDGVFCEWIAPKGCKPESVVLYLHGGAFCSGSPVTHRHLAGHLSKLTNAAVLVPDYRLAPEHAFPAALDDCRTCYSHLMSQGFSPNRIIVAGDSAGANLVLSLLVALRDSGTQLPAAGICLSPVTDLARRDEVIRRKDIERAPNDPMIRLHFIAPMIEQYVGDFDASQPLLSPLFADLHDLPPILIQAGGDELLLTDAERFTERARSAGGDVTLQVYPGMWHVWQIFIPYLPEARKAVKGIADFIVTHVGRPSGLVGAGS